MKNARTLIALCLLVLLTVMLTRDAQAQRQIIRIEESEDNIIKGEIAKPQVSMTVTRQNLNRDYQLVLRESFIDEIIKSIESAPF